MITKSSFDEIMIYVLVAECHAMRSFADSNCGILCKTRMHGV
jgi:hypothetical protein